MPGYMVFSYMKILKIKMKRRITSNIAWKGVIGKRYLEILYGISLPEMQ